jgi:replicative DNA helicase
MKISSLDEMSKYKGGIRGISSGFSKYDELTSGFHGSDLIILAARPAMGKTAFALNLALNVAKAGKHVLVYSLEMGNEQLFDRLLSIESKIKLSAIKDGTLKDSDYTDLGNGMGRLAELPLYISDSSSVNILEIKAVARRLKAEGKLDFMMIDYLQLINPTAGSKKSREQEISEISRSLKIIAKELNIPIVTLSQLSRSVEQRTDKRPILSDLRESGAIEQDADMVMFLYREKYYNKDNAQQPGDSNNSEVPSQYTKPKQQSNDEELEKVEVIVGKHRSGPTGTIILGFRPGYQQFVNVMGDDEATRHSQ